MENVIEGYEYIMLLEEKDLLNRGYISTAMMKVKERLSGRDRVHQFLEYVKSTTDEKKEEDRKNRLKEIDEELKRAKIHEST